jgi:winged helix DNA-binding protein
MAAPSNDILSRRLQHQKLTSADRLTATELVAWLGAVQAQDYPAAKWALGLRGKGLGDADVEQAFNDGKILRTHVLRPTWHFVSPDDIRWMLALTAPRVHALNAHYYRQAGLDDKTVKKSCALIQRSLAGGQHLTRVELAERLKRAKIAAEGLKLAYLMMHAELDGVICSGPRHDKQFTYALLDERAPKTTPITRDEALARLVERYFSSHGPATVRDFTCWSGLLVRDAKLGIEMAKNALVEETIDGRLHWSATAPPAPTKRRTSPVYLLPNYDEYLIAYKDRPAADSTRAANMEARSNGAFPHHLVIAGRLAGSWRRTVKANSVAIEVAPYKALSKADAHAVTGEADCYGEFLNMPVELTIY